MNGYVYKLPPSVQEVKCDQKDLEGYLELEVSLINFITATTSLKSKQNFNKLYIKKIYEQEEHKSNDTPLKNVIINRQNSASVNEISQEIVYSIESKEINCNNYNLNSVQVKIVWCGERTEDAANISISCKSQSQQNQHEQTENFKFRNKRKYQHIKKRNQKKHKQNHQPHQQEKQHFLLSANNKLRYRICTSGALFLEYLRSCKPIEIIVTSSGSCSTAAKPLGQAYLRLPLILLKKFNHNIAKGQNFAYKTKVYALYQHDKETVGKNLVKSGEIQLRFKMLFAPTAAAAATAVAAKHATVVIHEKQLNSSPLHHHNHRHNHHHHHSHHHHHLGGKSTKLQEDIQGDIPKRLTSQTKSEEIVEAMKKLDAKLVAYLAGETEISTKLSNCEEENEVNLNLENNNITNNLVDLLPATKLNIFKSITGIKLEMEALTLQPDGTKCINLLQNEIDPIFTVECQLSNELIKQVPRYNMFHLMQFESEKFQSLTQCTRFGQQAERAVKLDINEVLSDENANETELDFGRIHFTVWWREPGTCLNEMLGMGVLELNDLFNASLMEQCKRIEIQRRGKQLACLYFKIILQRELKSAQQKRGLFLSKQISSDSDSEKSSTTDNKNKSTISQQQTAQCVSNNNNAITGLSGTEKGEYAENFLFLKHTKIQ